MWQRRPWGGVVIFLEPKRVADFPEILVIRHGQTEWNAVGRHQGRKDSPLTAKGVEQARRIGVALVSGQFTLDGFGFFSSPQKRARDTAEIVLKGSDGKVTEDERLCEIGFGAWEGRTREEIDIEWPELQDMGDMFGWHFIAPGGESFEEVYARAESFLSNLPGPAIIFTHGITSRVLRGIWLGLDFDGMREIGGGQGCIFQLANGKQTRHEA